MSFHPFFLLTLLLLFSFSEQKINKNQVVLAINCGGDEYSDVNGIVYSEDKYYDRGTTSDHGLNYDISGTDDMDLYQTERWSPDTLTYSLPVKEEGKYVLILKFSEVYFQSAGDKIFDVALGKKTVLKNLDIFAKVGKAAALDEFIEFEIKNRKVYVDRTEAKNAYDADKKVLRVKFIKGPKDNPKINAILLIKGTINDTEYSEKKKKLDAINKKKLQEARKKLAIDLRHHSDEVFEEETLLNEDTESLRVAEDHSIISIFGTLPGMFILASICLFFVLNFLADFL